MAGNKGFAAVEKLAQRTQAQRGGNDRRPDHFDRSAPDALALCGATPTSNPSAHEIYAEGTLEWAGRDALKVFLAWAEPSVT